MTPDETINAAIQTAPDLSPIHRFVADGGSVSDLVSRTQERAKDEPQVRDLIGFLRVSIGFGTYNTPAIRPTVPPLTEKERAVWYAVAAAKRPDTPSRPTSFSLISKRAWERSHVSLHEDEVEECLKSLTEKGYMRSEPAKKGKRAYQCVIHRWGKP